ncbi:class I SAM-dependent methyltransferase [Nocardia speluncae]|uniref:Class I SAM-dependent methyltransferase n=1 Tax=Nocardia speluncae TaxID=419477 RepID=A0A846XGF4_9NOCA|nr:methyltransferase [Nocardia speluncae]NKY35451.1 class I SAM-dependent methyltransferase [Nocardia speluncae]
MTTIDWTENESAFSARWHSENASPAPARIVVIDDRTTANAAHRLAKAETGLLWRGDFHNARQLIRALERRRQRNPRAAVTGSDLASLFESQRAERSARAELLGRVLVVLEPGYELRLRRAPEVRPACEHAYGTASDGPAAGGTERVCVSLPELLGVLSAHQWHLRGVEIPALGARIHPDYGVFSPVRGEYIDLVARAPLPAGAGQPRVFDLGTGTGVLAAVLAQRGSRVVATDINPRAVRCARANLHRLGVADRARVVEADLWPDGRADLVICNPPWLPARPTSALELGIYDHNSDMLRRFLRGLPDHLTPGGEGWLILSDLAERLGLRTRDELRTQIAEAGLRVADRYDTSPQHPRATDAADPLHEARRQEITSLWRLVPD